MILYETIVSFKDGSTTSKMHSTRQSAVVTSLKHHENPDVKGIEVHRVAVTRKGKKDLDCTYTWTPGKE